MEDIWTPKITTDYKPIGNKYYRISIVKDGSATEHSNEKHCKKLGVWNVEDLTRRFEMRAEHTQRKLNDH